jgi:1-acyl-sn-glycerol-3-phosphate acyltransferase
MNPILGIIRLFLSAFWVVTATGALFLFSILPFKVKGYRPSVLVLGKFVRLLLRTLKVTVHCSDEARLREFSGFLFPNHVSYLDILVLLAVTPVSFLAKDDVRKMPFIGWIAKAIGCVFVERNSKESREAARYSLARKSYFPPIVLYPEGQRGDGTKLLPFRYGAFEIVTDVGAELLPCTITYDNLDIAIWKRKENIGRALWRVASYSKPLAAQITVLEPLQPAPGRDPVQLSESLHESMTAVWQEQQPSVAKS